MVRVITYSHRRLAPTSPGTTACATGKFSVKGTYNLFSPRDESRTRTPFNRHRILSPGRLPVPPLVDKSEVYTLSKPKFDILNRNTFCF